MSEHTPGPWVVCPIQKEDLLHSRKVGTGPEGWLGVAQAHGDTQEEADANARLIAAAPDLLEACRIALVYLESDADDQQEREDWAQIRVAIHKAEGKP